MSTATPSTPLLPALGRIFWVLAGPMALTILAMVIIRVGEGWFTIADVAFLAVLAALPAARWLEFQGGDPRTSTGSHASHRQFRRYVVLVFCFGLGVWIIANLLGNHLLRA